MYAEKYQALGRQIRYYRILRGLGQCVLADRAGVTPQYLSKLEHGAAKPSLDLLFALADVLQVTASELLE